MRRPHLRLFTRIGLLGFAAVACHTLPELTNPGTVSSTSNATPVQVITPLPAPSPLPPSGSQTQGVVVLVVQGVFPSSSVDVLVNGVLQPGLVNSSYPVTTNAPIGAPFFISIASTGPGLTCSVEPGSGTLAAGNNIVAVQCGRSLGFSQNQAAAMVIGQDSFVDGDPGAGASGLSGPRGVIFAEQLNRLYITDLGNARIATLSAPRVTYGPALDTLANPNGNAFSMPRRVSVNEAGQVAVADSGKHQIMIYFRAPDPPDAPNVILGSGTASSNIGQFSGPFAAFLLNHNMIVADTGNNRVLLYDGVPTDDNAQPSYVLGAATLGAAGSGVCSPVSLSAPEDVWSNGTALAVADASNNRVVVWQTYPTANNQPPDVILGSAACAPGALANQLRTCGSVAGDVNSLFVADTGNNRILAFPWLHMQDGMAAAYALGQIDTSSNTANQAGTPNANTLSSPLGLGFWNNALVVADTGNNRVLVYASH